MNLSQIIQKYKATIPGGKGNDTKIDSVDKKELAVGIAVEMEHTDDIIKAAEISIDHLTENEKYYTELIASGIVDEKKAIELAKQFGWKIGAKESKENIKKIVREIVKKYLREDDIESMANYSIPVKIKEGKVKDLEIIASESDSLVNFIKAVRKKYPKLLPGWPANGGKGKETMEMLKKIYDGLKK